MLKWFAKYWLVFQLSWQNQFVYRASLLIWRVRNILQSFVALSVWSIVFSQNTSSVIFGYTQNEIISYIFLTAVIQSLILSTSLHGLANQVYSGQINYQLIKPINMFLWLATDDASDKLKNFVFVLLESALLFIVFKPQLNFLQSTHAALFIGWIMLGVALHFIINLLFGTIGFWSPDVWGPKFLFFMLVDFTSGKLYPLDVLPPIAQSIAYLTPFPYLSYVQTQLIMGRFDMNQAFFTTLVMCSWIVGLAIVTHRIWQHGLKHYTAAGQ